MTRRLKVQLDRCNAEIAYADLTSNNEEERGAAARKAAALGASWVEFYLDGALVHRAEKVRS